MDESVKSQWKTTVPIAGVLLLLLGFSAYFINKRIKSSKSAQKLDSSLFERIELRSKSRIQSIFKSEEKIDSNPVEKTPKNNTGNKEEPKPFYGVPPIIPERENEPKIPAPFINEKFNEKSLKWPVNFNRPKRKSKK